MFDARKHLQALCTFVEGAISSDETNSVAACRFYGGACSAKDLTPSKGWKGSVPPLPLPRMKMPEPNKKIEQVASAIAFSMHLHHTESALRALEFRHLDTVLYFAAQSSKRFSLC